METVILTGDTDILQLVSPHVRVQIFTSFRGPKIYDETEVRKRFGGLEPTVQPDFKAIVGDSSDNIPGLPGLGKVAATKLLLKFGTIEGIYDQIEEVTPPRAKKILMENRDEASSRQGPDHHPN